MRVTLIRHGHADEAAVDAERALTQKGRAVVRQISETLVARQARFDLMITSPLVRAVQTAEIVAERLGHDGDVLVDRCLVPESRPGAVVDRLLELGAEGSIALVAHEPILSALAGHFLGTPFRALRKGEAVRIRLPEGPEAGGELRWWIDPRSAVVHKA